MSTCRADQWPVVPEEGGRESLGCEAATHSEEKTFFIHIYIYIYKRMICGCFSWQLGELCMFLRTGKITFSQTTT